MDDNLRTLETPPSPDEALKAQEAITQAQLEAEKDATKVKQESTAEQEKVETATHTGFFENQWLGLRKSL